MAPFDIETISQIPKTVYAFNPIFFVCESLEQMDALLDSYLKPIALRTGIGSSKHHHLPRGRFHRVAGDLLFKGFTRQQLDLEQAAQ